jgi:hypothetical protein
MTMRRLKCLFGRHDYRVVDGWQRPKRTDGLIGLPHSTSESADHVYANGDIRVKCDHCGKRAFARFRREHRRNLWLETGVDADTEPKWHTVVNPFGLFPQLASGPTHAEIAKEVDW